jgi:hypothetical protein
MSRGFIAALAGIAMTILSWYGPWAWPAAPAFGTLHLFFGSGQSWIELPESQRAAILVLLIAINVGSWAAVAWILLRLRRWSSAP